jgi:hypothetical protein
MQTKTQDQSKGWGGKREGSGRRALGKVRVVLLLPPDLDRQLEERAEQYGGSKSGLVEKALAAYLAQSKQP